MTKFIGFHRHLMILIFIFQIEKIFAGYIGSDNDTMVLQDFFRTLPKIIENRVVQNEWSLVIKLSNQIFKVLFLIDFQFKLFL